jgi:RHS repeat-associated protein
MPGVPIPSWRRAPPLEYERIEYTPYGESWIEKAADGVEMLPFRFTGKELDAETGLHYYGARYLNPKTSVWISADPALGEYLPEAPVDDEAKKRNGNLPGQGGVFNLVTALCLDKKSHSLRCRDLHAWDW